MSLFKLGLFVVAITMSLTQCIGNAFAAPPRAAPSVASNAKSQANQATARMKAKFMAQCMASARKELVKEEETKARARLEAIQELSAETIQEPETAQGGSDEQPCNYSGNTANTYSDEAEAAREAAQDAHAERRYLEDRGDHFDE